MTFARLGKLRFLYLLALAQLVGSPLVLLQVTLDCLNLLGRDDNDIGYFYPSRLAGEPEIGVEAVHLQPAEPRTFRDTLTRRF
jgi:hypothetical protein